MLELWLGDLGLVLELGFRRVKVGIRVGHVEV